MIGGAAPQFARRAATTASVIFASALTLWASGIAPAAASKRQAPSTIIEKVTFEGHGQYSRETGSASGSGGFCQFTHKSTEISAFTWKVVWPKVVLHLRSTNDKLKPQSVRPTGKLTGAYDITYGATTNCPGSPPSTHCQDDISHFSFPEKAGATLTVTRTGKHAYVFFADAQPRQFAERVKCTAALSYYQGFFWEKDSFLGAPTAFDPGALSAPVRGISVGVLLRSGKIIDRVKSSDTQDPSAQEGTCGQVPAGATCTAAQRWNGYLSVARVGQ